MNTNLKIGDWITSLEYGGVIGKLVELNGTSEAVVDIGHSKEDIIYCNIKKCKYYVDKHNTFEINYHNKLKYPKK